MVRLLITIFAALALLAIVVFAAPSADAATTKTSYITGYSLYDNDPPGTKAIAFPGPSPRHSQAGGWGTYANPTTLAVGLNSSGQPFLPVGTRVYIPAFRDYAIVEDSCAACTSNWYDIWVGGETNTVAEADACMNKITGNHTVVINPPSNYKVRGTGTTPLSGDIAHAHGCIRLFGETPEIQP